MEQAVTPAAEHRHVVRPLSPAPLIRPMVDFESSVPVAELAAVVRASKRRRAPLLPLGRPEVVRVRHRGEEALSRHADFAEETAREVDRLGGYRLGAGERIDPLADRFRCGVECVKAPVPLGVGVLLREQVVEQERDVLEHALRTLVRPLAAQRPRLFEALTSRLHHVIEATSVVRLNRFVFAANRVDQPVWFTVPIDQSDNGGDDMPKRGPWYPLRSRKTGRVTKSGYASREYFLPVPVWYIDQGLAPEGRRYEFRPDYETGEIIYRPEGSAAAAGDDGDDRERAESDA